MLVNNCSVLQAVVTAADSTSDSESLVISLSLSLLVTSLFHSSLTLSDLRVVSGDCDGECGDRDDRNRKHDEEDPMRRFIEGKLIAKTNTGSVTLLVPVVKMSENPHITGAQTIEPPRRLDNLRAITRLPPVKNCTWGVMAFVLNEDLVQADGTVDPLRAMVFHLGSFRTKEEARNHAINIIAVTGHPGVVIGQYGSGVELTTEFDTKNVEQVYVDPSGKLMKLQQQQYQHDKEVFEKRAALEKDLVTEAEAETDPDSIEHFKRQAFLAIKNQSKVKFLEKELAHAKTMYAEREAAVRDHYQRHPEHEEQWLPYLKAKLLERGESKMYGGLEQGYQEIREQLLGLTDECEGGVCMATAAASEEPVQEPANDGLMESQRTQEYGVLKEWDTPTVEPVEESTSAPVEATPTAAPVEVTPAPAPVEVTPTPAPVEVAPAPAPVEVTPAAAPVLPPVVVVPPPVVAPTIIPVVAPPPPRVTVALPPPTVVRVTPH